MYIVNSKGTKIVNSDFMDRFFILKKTGETLIVCARNADSLTATLGVYADEEEAKGVLADLLYALTGGQSYHYMPLGRLQDGEKMIKDARVKRRGGS